MTPRVLIIIPTLNEVDHIDAVLNGLLPFAESHGARIVVADGGSTDGTRDRVAARPEAGITLIDNPRRLQSAAVNLAVARFGAEADMLIRIDAHSAYPQDYCDVLLAEAQETGAASVVVGMRAVGSGFWQGLIAAAQNSRIGNGGAAHRVAPVGRFVDHGHHALMRIDAFRQIGGYDESFSHNEDAELDLRLRQAGFRIWLTARTRVDYFPRRTIPALMKQYFAFGRGRARNILKHRSVPGLRQIVLAGLAPGLMLALLTPLHPVFALPLILWGAGCLAGGALIARETRSLRGLLAGFAAGAMHVAWSAGFWNQLLRHLGRGRGRSEAPA
ncbi:glycosyltransferase family 2 protein [Cereibacter azotoformans]|uniref:glycosyltransferase family 2 protein n=1 Tax=Cereibacter azotoformans TaxID=43057 RepID=UPI001EEC83CF|nr:glycosyltransferase family 2 protein [Cereibacter azotoformans]ULB10096.1 glycosyltransferase family 2 protein [Cereibacter azotoformans]